MQRFIEEQNIALFHRLLSDETCESKKKTLRSLLLQSQRKLALIESASHGAFPTAWASRKQLFPKSAPRLSSRFQQEFESAPTPLLLIDPRPGLHLVDANKHYAAAAMIDVNKVGGEKMFDVFPDNPDDPLANGVAHLFASLAIVAQTGRPHAMAVQRYDIRDARGTFVERHWQPLNSPVFNDAGDLSFILHQVIDVTAQSIGRTAETAPSSDGFARVRVSKKKQRVPCRHKAWVEPVHKEGLSEQYASRHQKLTDNLMLLNRSLLMWVNCRYRLRFARARMGKKRTVDALVSVS